MAKRSPHLSPDRPGGRKSPPVPEGLTHTDSYGRAKMVDVGGKQETLREAVAFGRVEVAKETLKKIEHNLLAKGDVLSAAKLAGIQAAKKTHELIPLCHPLRIVFVDLDFALASDPPQVQIRATVRARDRTGVEMEALTAAAAAALTVYDMCKAVDRRMRISDLILVKKSGGRSGAYQTRGLRAFGNPGKG